MLFSEANGELRAIPPWARFLIDFGYRWPWTNMEARRIALISMPCESAAAGLITLGAMIRDLGQQQANDIDGHYDALMRYARQYLESCRHCNLQTCDPDQQGCGYTSRATGRLRSPCYPHQTALVSDRTSFQNRQIALQHAHGMVEWPTPQYAINWYTDGDPPPQWNKAEGELPGDAFAQLVGGAIILPDNVRKSYSGLCLAGRVAGESQSREMCATVRFIIGEVVYGLDELITVNGWSGFKISRVAFFNSRTDTLDRNTAFSSLVVADGDTSLLKVLGRTGFHQSDIVGVVHRTMERDKLEAVGNRMVQMKQWYSPDCDMLTVVPPRGISISILKKRA